MKAIIDKDQILDAARKLGCSFRMVAHYVRIYGKVDMNELSISIYGEPYNPKPQQLRDWYRNIPNLYHGSFKKKWIKALQRKSME